MLLFEMALPLPTSSPSLQVFALQRGLVHSLNSRGRQDTGSMSAQPCNPRPTACEASCIWHSVRDLMLRTDCYRVACCIGAGCVLTTPGLESRPLNTNKLLNRFGLCPAVNTPYTRQAAAEPQGAAVHLRTSSARLAFEHAHRSSCTA